MRLMVQDFFFGGAWMSMSQYKYRIGFKSTIADKLYEGMQFDQGDVYMVTRNVTPVFLDNFGHMQKQKIDILTGSNSLSDIGKVKLINGQPYINREKEFWNGSKNTSVFISPRHNRDEDRYTSNKKIVDIYNGMQIIPKS